MYEMKCVARVAVLAALLLVAGCATLGPKAPAASPAAVAQYTNAQSLYAAGNYRAAAAEFLAAAHADTALRARATLGAAASYRSLGQFARATALLQQVDPRQLGSDDAALYQVLSADAALHAGHANAALQQAGSLPATAPPGIRQRALDVVARAQLLRGDRLAAARALAQRLPLLAPAAQASERQRVIAILAGMGRPQLAAALATLAPSDPVRPYAEQALQHAGKSQPQALPQPEQPVGTLIGSALPQGYAMPHRIALLLPATGPVATAATAVRDGFFMGYFHAPVTNALRPSLQVYDTGGTPAGALAAYQQAIAAGAQLVVGPLGRAAVATLFAQAALPIPVLALNRPQGDAPAPIGSVEFALRPEAEGAQLAAHMIEQGLHAAIVFRTADNTAQRTFDAFRVQFVSLGGQVANDIVLPKDAIDFAGQIQAALAGAGSETGVVALLRPLQGRLLLPQLRLARSTLPVFATSMIYSGIPNATADGDLDGVQFCDAPWLYNAQVGLPNQAVLADSLETADGPAARLFAFGMDAYRLMPYVGWLRSHPGSYVPGATGQLTIDTLGQVQRVPIWVRFQDGLAQLPAASLETPPPTPDP